MKVCYAILLELAAGAVGEATVFTVPAMRNFKLRRARCWGTGGLAARIDLIVLRGRQVALPRSGYLSAFTTPQEAEGEANYQAEEPVIVSYNNRDTVNPQSAYIIIEGELTKVE